MCVSYVESSVQGVFPHIHFTVGVRVRPLSTQEIKASTRSRNVPLHFRHKKADPGDVYAWTTMGEDTIVQKGVLRINGKSLFHFDSIFDETSTTRQVYDSMGRQIVQGVATGRNGTILLYGQTASGKTHTMQGDTCEDAGFVQMAATDLFADINERSVERVFVVKVSYIEIYNEKVRDLLSSRTSDDETGTQSSLHSDKNSSDDLKTLAVREDPKRGGVYVNSNEWQVHSASAIVDALRAGSKNRAASRTAMNDRSSRSHAIFRITVESRQKMEKEGVEGVSDGRVVRVSCLNLVDLAGSETGHQSGAQGHCRLEGGKINQRYELLISNRGVGIPKSVSDLCLCPSIMKSPFTVPGHSCAEYATRSEARLIH